jgi:hypothetical protein
MVLRYARLDPQGDAPVLDPWFIAAAALAAVSWSAPAVFFFRSKL